MLANKNNLRSELTSNVSSSATSINITSWEWILRENNMVACLEHYEWEICTKREIIKITAKNSDSFTVSRWFAVCIMNDQTKAQGNTPQTFSTGDFLSLYFSKELRESITTWCVNNAEAIAQMSEHITTIKNCIDWCCNNRIAKVWCLNDSHFTNGWFWNASDWDCVVEAWNHFREANKVYNFRNLTICEWACIRFEGEWVPQIKVYDHYINNGVIDTRAWYKKTCACWKQICFWKNCCASGDNSDNNCIVPWMYWVWWCGCDSWATIHWCSWCCASWDMWWYGWKGWDWYIAWNVCNPWWAWWANDWCNGWTWWYWGSWPWASCWSGWTGWGWGWWGWAWRFWNGWDWWHGWTGWWNYNYRTRAWWNGWVWWNSWLWWRWWNGWVWWTNWPSEIWWCWWNGWCWYIGWNGWTGWNTAWQSWRNWSAWWTGWNWGCWVICWWNGWNSWCWNCASCWTHHWWNWWNALTNIYWLIMNVRCACWTGCIRACGWTGWNGWTTPWWYNLSWYGWNGWNGANGWQVIYAYMHWTPETICVNGWAWGCWGSWNWYCDWQPWTAWTDWRKLVYMVSTDLDLARFIATQDEEYLLRLLSSESWIEAVAWSTQALRIIANDTELLSDVLSYTTIVNALISDSTCLWYIAWSHTSMVLVKDNTTIMNALIVDSTALWAISQQDFFDYVLENETFLSTCVWSTAWANKVNSIDADDLLEPIYFYTWDLWYDSWTTLSEDDDAMETLENNANAMLIIESNDEASQYFGRKPWENTIAYYPLDSESALLDKSWNWYNSNWSSNIWYETLSSWISVVKLTWSDSWISVPWYMFDQVWTWDFTISYWLKPVWNWWWSEALTFCQWKDVSPYYWPNIWYSKNSYSNWNFFFRFYWWSSQWWMYSVNDKNTFDHNAFHHICRTRINWVNTWYIDWVQVCQATNSFQSSPTWNYWYIISRYSANQQLSNGAMWSQLIFEKAWRTSEYVVKYFNKLKRKYGLS